MIGSRTHPVRGQERILCLAGLLRIPPASDTVNGVGANACRIAIKDEAIGSTDTDWFDGGNPTFTVAVRTAGRAQSSPRAVNPLSGRRSR